MLTLDMPARATLTMFASLDISSEFGGLEGGRRHRVEAGPESMADAVAHMLLEADMDDRAAFMQRLAIHFRQLDPMLHDALMAHMGSR